MSSIFKRPDNATIDLIRRSGDSNPAVAAAAQMDLAIALTEPLRQGVLAGPTTDNIFTPVMLEPGATPDFPLDPIAPGDEDLYVAFTNPGHGRIPEQTVEGDYVMIPTYSIANSVDGLLRFARDARYDVIGRALQGMKGGIVKKTNDDGWHTLMAAGADRNIVVYDADATAGLFTKRLLTAMSVTMQRAAGGNHTSIRRGRLTDVYTSLEAVEDVRNWNLDQVDELTRREIYLANDNSGTLTKIMGIQLHPMYEFGEDMEYQDYYVNVLGGALASSDVELVVGLDLSSDDSFVMPVREELQIFPDPALHRWQKWGFYGWMESGLAVLDSRRVILGSF